LRDHKIQFTPWNFIVKDLKTIRDKQKVQMRKAQDYWQAYVGPNFKTDSEEDLARGKYPEPAQVTQIMVSLHNVEEAMAL
jgi:hypothetical protein